MKRLGLRLAAILPVAFLAACSEQDVGEAIEDAILKFLGAIGKVILISLGLLLAFSAVLFVGMAIIALGLRRKKVDAGALAFFVLGGGVILSAWPLIFSQSGLAGVWAPDSTGGVSAEPVAGQAVAVVAGIVIAVVAVKRYRKKEAAKGAAVVPATPAPLVPAAPPPLPDAVVTPMPLLDTPPLVPAAGEPREQPKPRPKKSSSKPKSIGKRPKAGSKSR